MLIFVISNEMFCFNVVANQLCHAHLANQNASLSKSLVPAVQLAVRLGAHWQSLYFTPSLWVKWGWVWTSQYLLRYVHPLTFIFLWLGQKHHNRDHTWLVGITLTLRRVLSLRNKEQERRQLWCAAQSILCTLHQCENKLLLRGTVTWPDLMIFCLISPSSRKR